MKKWNKSAFFKNIHLRIGTSKKSPIQGKIYATQVSTAQWSWLFSRFASP